ncbi:MAG: histidine phosphatase family protein [Rhodocyclaceae bacterium]
MQQATRICLIRHGETAWNAEMRIQGQIDVPLSEAGLAQARAAARRLRAERFDAIHASDLARARQTAQEIATVQGLPVQVSPWLRERRYGIFESLTYAQARERHPHEFARHARREEEFDFCGGESLREFAARVLAGMAGILARHAGQQVLLVTHGGVLDIVHRRASGKPLAAPRDFEIPNAAIHWIEAAGQRWSIVSWAQRDHLHGAIDELPG